MVWWSRLLPAATFVVGLLIGGLLIGLGTDGDGATDEPAGDAPTETATAPGDEPTTVLVPASCAEAGREAELAVEYMRDGAAAVRDVQPEKLAEVLNDLEDTQARLEKLSAECSRVEVESAQ
ncbi:hypothetical protein BH20ACT6_BH20ACT6_21840 [soil metagenome]